MAHKSGDIICFNRNLYINPGYAGRIYWMNTQYSYWLWGQNYTANAPSVGSTLSHGSSIDIGDDSIDGGSYVAPYNCRLVGIAYNLLQGAKDTGATYFKFVVFRQEITNGTARADDATWENIGEIQSPDRSGETASKVVKKSVILNSSNGDINADDVLVLGLATYGGTSSDGQGLLRGAITVMLEVR